MRLDTSLLPNSLLQSPKILQNKQLTTHSPGALEFPEEAPAFYSSPFGSSGTYSVSSLRAAVDYHAKFLTVAENNLEAVHHPDTVPSAIIERLNRS